MLDMVSSVIHSVTWPLHCFHASFRFISSLLILSFHDSQYPKLLFVKWLLVHHYCNTHMSPLSVQLNRIRCCWSYDECVYCHTFTVILFPTSVLYIRLLQGEIIDRIEDEVIKTGNHVGAGNKQLIEASKHRSKARKVVCFYLSYILTTIYRVSLA